MRALVAPEPGRLVLDEVPDPTVSAGQVLVRSRVTAVSAGTELRMLYEGRTEHGPDPDWPAIGAFGYLAAGDVIAVGADVTDVQEGDRVACGCAWGAHREILDVDAALLQPLPSDLGYLQGACAYWAVPPLCGILAGRPRFYDDAAVVGLGPLGLTAVQMLVPFCRRVVAIDQVAMRCAAAERYGALAIDSSVSDARTQLHRVLPTSPRVVIQAAGSQPALELSMDIVAAGGTIVNVGTLPPTSSLDLFWPLQMSGAQIVPIHRPGDDRAGRDDDRSLGASLRRRYLPDVIEMMQRHRLDIASLCTWALPVDLAPRAIPFLRGNPDRCLGLAFAWSDADVKGLAQFTAAADGSVS